MKISCAECNGVAPYIPGGFKKLGKVAKVKPRWRQALRNHYRKFFGDVFQVYHEELSKCVHLDFNVFPANEKRPWHTLVTEGISERQCFAPNEFADYRRIELMFYLPPHWDFSQLLSCDEWSWPLRMAQYLGRYVHQRKTFFIPGHSFGPGNEDDCYIFPGSKLNNMLFAFPADEEEDFNLLYVEGKPVSFIRAIPITPAEVQYKCDVGIEPLLQLLDWSDALGPVDTFRDCTLSFNSDSVN